MARSIIQPSLSSRQPSRSPTARRHTRRIFVTATPIVGILVYVSLLSVYSSIETPSATTTTTQRLLSSVALSGTASNNNNHEEAPTFVRPLLESLISHENKSIIGDVQFLLDFAHVGFPKTGSTSMNQWLRKHPEANMPGGEMELLSKGKPTEAIKVLYNLPHGDYKRGFKSPWDIINKGGALQNIHTHFPKTKLIIGLRHPISWFESFYNYRLLRMNMPHPNDLLEREVKGLSATTANFHVYLSRLGKTNMTAPEELAMIQAFPNLLIRFLRACPIKSFSTTSSKWQI